MAATSREILKSWFETGQKPTEEQFAALIDSFRHLDDESTENITTINNIIKDSQLKTLVKENDFVYICDSENENSLRRVSISNLKLILGNNYEQSFENRSAVAVVHNLNRYPSVMAIDSANREFVVNVTHIDRDTCTVSWTGETSGKIVCN
jgi:hypothetical protein